jgi:predicted RNase H-like HicB family nuclease
MFGVLSQGRTSEDTLDRIAPLWDFLFKEYSGLLYADGEGYYDAEGEVLMVA